MMNIVEIKSKLSEIKGNLERKWEWGAQRAGASTAVTAEALFNTINTIEELSEQIF